MGWAFGFQRLRDYVFNTAKAKTLKLTRGNYPAPLKILECIKTGVERGPDEGYKTEAKVSNKNLNSFLLLHTCLCVVFQLFGELAMTKESQALIGLFFGQTECKKNRFGDPPKPPK